MSKQMKPEIMIRIKAAPLESPIAVFTSTEPMHYRASFFNTVAVQSAIKKGDSTFVGAYHKDSKGEAMRVLR